jgi:hypothetical protein
LGRYSTELEAHNKYQQVLKDLSLNKTAWKQFTLFIVSLLALT